MNRNFLFFAVFAVVFFLNRNSMGQWVRVGSPDDSSTINSLVAMNPNASPTILFAGISSSFTTGVFRSTDNGSSWKAVDSSLSAPFVKCFAVIGTKLFAGNGDGVFLTSDTGRSWSQVNTGLIDLSINDFAVSGTNLFAGTCNGVYLTTNNGVSWNAANSGISTVCVHSLVVNGSNLYAGSSGSGVFLSTDDGTSWGHGVLFPAYSTYVISLAAIGVNVFANTHDGVFLSIDSGTSWTDKSIGLPYSINIHTGLKNYNIKDIVSFGTDLIAGIPSSGVYLSTNYGTIWSAINTGLKDSTVESLVVTDSFLYVGTGNGGVWRRPLSEMIGSNAVASKPEMEYSILSYPNPFSQSTTIKFSSSDHSFAQVSIHNLLGSEVARLFTGSLDAREHSFTWDAQSMPPGMYVAMVKIGGEVREIPMMLVK